MSARANLVEVFASLQGEGLYCGEPQIFIRFGGCSLRCLYCDTPQGLVAPAEWIAHFEPVQRGENPVDVAQVLSFVAALDQEWNAPRTLSITGGEPLIQAPFLKELLPHWHGTRRIHLETAGAHPRALESVAGWLDHVSMDWKLASTMERGNFDQRHCEFLDVIAARAVDACVKFVITSEVFVPEFLAALDQVLARLPSIPIYLQPATPDRAVLTAPPEILMSQLARAAAQRGARVRVLPQVHKLLGIR